MSAHNRVGVATLLVVFGSVLAGLGTAATTGPFHVVAGGFLGEWEVESSSPKRVEDRLAFFGTGGFTAQHTLVFNRVFDPDTGIGRVSGTIGATGPNNWRGRLHGRITSTGMEGHATVERFAPDGSVTARFVGSWSSESVPVEPTLGLTTISVVFEGKLIEFAPPE